MATARNAKMAKRVNFRWHLLAPHYYMHYRSAWAAAKVRVYARSCGKLGPIANVSHLPSALPVFESITALRLLRYYFAEVEPTFLANVWMLGSVCLLAASCWNSSWNSIWRSISIKEGIFRVETNFRNKESVNCGEIYKSSDLYFA